jgi:hypothetical protein
VPRSRARRTAGRAHPKANGITPAQLTWPGVRSVAGACGAWHHDVHCVGFRSARGVTTVFTRAVAPALATGTRTAAPLLAPPGRRPARACPGLPVAQTKRIFSMHSQCARTAAARRPPPWCPFTTALGRSARGRSPVARRTPCCGTPPLPVLCPSSARHVSLIFFFVVQSSPAQVRRDLFDCIKLFTTKREFD